MDRRNQCYNKPPCNGNGRGIYRSKYIKMPGWKSYWSAESSCTCKCNPGWVGANCKTYMATSQCQSVGDPHPLSLDGLRFNMYDAGEFLMFKHPQSPVEIHLLTRMAHPRISATAGIAVRRGHTVISIEQPHCGNGNNFQVRASVDGRCRNIGWGRRWGWKDGLYYNGGRYIYMRGVGNIYIGGWWRYRWWKGQCGSAYWLNVYVRIRAPRDGRAQGLCGTFRGNRNTDENYLIQKRGQRRHHQIARKTRDENMVAAKDSFFFCGAWKPGFRYSPYFKSLRSGESAASTRKRMENAAMMDAEQKLSREFARDKATNKRTLGDEEKTAMSKENALSICKKKEDIVTEEALSNCVNDLMTTGDEKVEKVAAKESEEEEEEAKENLKEEEDELIVEEKLKTPDKFDPVLQYCYGDNCHTKWGEFNESNWKQWKAYPEKVYGTFLDKWKTMTARIPDEARNSKFMFRFMQANHTCYCCNDFYVTNVKVESGGLPIAMIAEQEFESYGDGKLIGHGEWFEPAKDTSRFRAPLGIETFAIKAKGGKNGRSGILGMFGKDLVTSSSWKCSVEQDGQGTWMKPDFDDSKWPTAVEEGQNGILPWGERPGISKKAFWIFTHDTYNMRGQQVYCRVNVKKAVYSDSVEEDLSSRWSCKEGENRGAPKSIQMNGDMMSSVEIKSGSDKEEHFSPSSAITAAKEKSDGSETRILMRLNTEKFVSETVEGQMLKNVVLRLFVLDDTKDDLLVCKLIRPWSVADVTWMTAPAFDGPASNCIKMKNKLITKGQWVDIDLTVWMREWVTSSEHNYGIMIMPTGFDGVGFVSYLDPDANQRPRLSLSCHGDNFDTTHSASNKFVFRETRSKLVSERKKKGDQSAEDKKNTKKNKKQKNKTEKNSLPRRLRRTKAPKKKIDHKAKVQEKRKKPVEENYHPKYVDSDGWVVSNASSYKDVEEHEKRKIAEKGERKKAEERDKEEKKKDKIREQKEKKEMEETKKRDANSANGRRKEENKKKHEKYKESLEEAKKKEAAAAAELVAQARLNQTYIEGNRTEETTRNENELKKIDTNETNTLAQQHKEALEDTLQKRDAILEKRGTKNAF